MLLVYVIEIHIIKTPKSVKKDDKISTSLQSVKRTRPLIGTSSSTKLVDTFKSVHSMEYYFYLTNLVLVYNDGFRVTSHPN